MVIFSSTHHVPVNFADRVAAKPAIACRCHRWIKRRGTSSWDEPGDCRQGLNLWILKDTWLINYIIIFVSKDENETKDIAFFPIMNRIQSPWNAIQNVGSYRIIAIFQLGKDSHDKIWSDFLIQDNRITLVIMCCHQLSHCGYPIRAHSHD